MKAGILPIPFAIALAGIPAYGQTERIEKLSSDIAIRHDGTLSITETIRVYETGDNVSDRAYIKFPSVYNNKSGHLVTMEFKVNGVTRDGQRQPFRTRSFRDSFYVEAGAEHVFIPAGWRTYTFTYEADRGVEFFKDHDELYWNVNRTTSDFVIGAVECSVSFPGPVSEGSLALDAWTGKTGAKGKDFARAVGADGKIRFQTTRPIDSLESLTILVSWPKGLVAEPRWEQRAAWFVRDNKGAVVASTGILVVLFYYLLVWYRVGRDPKKKTVVPLYSPPEDLSPAAMRYVRYMDYDNKCFTSAIIDMAVKKHIKIVKDRGRYTLHKLSEECPALSVEERRASAVLFEGRDRITFEDIFQKEVSSAISAVKESLKDSYFKKYFTVNASYMVPGIFMSLLTLVVAGHAQKPAGTMDAMISAMLLFSVLTAVGIRALGKAATAWRNARGLGSAGSCIGVVSVGCIVLLSWAGLLYLYVEDQSLPLAQTIIVAVILLLLGLLFHYLLKAWTPAGRKLMDEIEGFRMFLSATEKDRIGELCSAEVTPEAFERFLPYALALEVAGVWAQRLASALEATESARPSDCASEWNGGWRLLIEIWTELSRREEPRLQRATRENTRRI